jgi:hypothetical protein
MLGDSQNEDDQSRGRGSYRPSGEQNGQAHVSGCDDLVGRSGHLHGRGPVAPSAEARPEPGAASHQRICSRQFWLDSNDGLPRGWHRHDCLGSGSEARREESRSHCPHSHRIVGSRRFAGCICSDRRPWTHHDSRAGTRSHLCGWFRPPYFRDVRERQEVPQRRGMERTASADNCVGLDRFSNVLPHDDLGRNRAEDLHHGLLHLDARHGLSCEKPGAICVTYPVQVGASRVPGGPTRRSSRLAQAPRKSESRPEMLPPLNRSTAATYDHSTHSVRRAGRAVHHLRLHRLQGLRGYCVSNPSATLLQPFACLLTVFCGSRYTSPLVGR